MRCLGVSSVLLGFRLGTQAMTAWNVNVPRLVIDRVIAVPITAVPTLGADLLGGVV